MKILFILPILTIYIFAQEYERGKIDTHGGKFNNYNSIGGYKDGGIKFNGNNLSKFLDSNTSKKFNEKKNPRSF